jgi:RNA polymerase sigma factor (sigma-70 family)
MTAPEPDPAEARPAHAAGAGPADAAAGAVPGAAGSDADQAIAAIYGTQYRSLVRLAALLVGDAGPAEAVVQDSFVAMYDAWGRLQDRDQGVSYLRQSVVVRSRSIRRRMTAEVDASERAPPAPSAGQEASAAGQETSAAGQETGAAPERPAVISALRALPPRQREALVLRFYLDLSDGQAASAMGISRGAVARHAARAMAALPSFMAPEG